MTDFRSETTIGSRIKLARRQRGYRTARELADAIPGGNITAAILENIESGRKSDLSVSQLLNIARALDVPPMLLLARTGQPTSGLDLPNLSNDFDGMSVAEFDCWLSATPTSFYRPRLAAERSDISFLNSLRDLGMLRRELERLHLVLDVQRASGDADLVEREDEILDRIERITREAARVTGLLVSAGLSADFEPSGSHASANVGDDR